MTPQPRAESTTSRGRRAEEWARRYLESRGLETLEQNYRCRAGEIDLIMRHGSEIVFVEVRRRTSDRFGSGADSIDWSKQRKLATTAEHFLQAGGLSDSAACRFDVVSIGGDAAEIEWIEAAFDASA